MNPTAFWLLIANIVQAGLVASLVGLMFIRNEGLPTIKLGEIAVFAPVGQIIHFELKGMPCIQIQRGKRILLKQEYVLALSSGVTCDWSKHR